MKYIAEVCRAQVLLAQASAARKEIEAELSAMEVGTPPHVALSQHLAELTANVDGLRESIREANQFIPGFA